MKTAIKTAAAKKHNTRKQAKKVNRVTIFEHSATSVLKAMGKLGYTTEQASKVCSKLASGEVKPSTIATALSDGKNVNYNSGSAKLSVAEKAKIKKAAGK